jgi:predicted MFS family arabinose efflux permease
LAALSGPVYLAGHRLFSPELAFAMHRSWRAVLLLTVFLQLLGFGLVLPLLPYYARALGAGPAAIGGLFAAYSLTQFLLAPVWGRLADSFGRRPILLICIGWGIVAYLLFAVAHGYAALFVSRVMAGLSAAVIGVSQAYLVDRTEPADRARNMGLLGAALGLGFVFGPALGAFLSRWGYALPGYVAAGLTAVNLALAARWLPESLPADERRVAASARRQARLPGSGERGLAAVFGILFLTTAGFSILYPVFPLFVHERLGFGPMEAGYLFSAMGVVAVLIQGGLLGRLAGWIGERRLLAVGTLVMGLALALTPLPFVRSLVVLGAVMLPMALGYAVTTPIAQTLLSRLSDPLDQASNLGLGQSMTSLARAVGPLAGGFLFQHVGTPYPFWMAALLLLVATGLAGRVPLRGVSLVPAAARWPDEVSRQPAGPTGSLAGPRPDGGESARATGDVAEESPATAPSIRP